MKYIASIATRTVEFVSYRHRESLVDVEVGGGRKEEGLHVRVGPRSCVKRNFENVEELNEIKKPDERSWTPRKTYKPWIYGNGVTNSGKHQHQGDFSISFGQDPHGVKVPSSVPSLVQGGHLGALRIADCPALTTS
uniref:Uncharacterized protein n=1 Tax=Vespula pensylvanica TaxID=30213 RepID=A0A834P454_VESPE|nr:hypothetical protein H0235_007058 [Vespula pensylvanica]